MFARGQKIFYARESTPPTSPHGGIARHTRDQYDTDLFCVVVGRCQGGDDCTDDDEFPRTPARCVGTARRRWSLQHEICTVRPGERWDAQMVRGTRDDDPCTGDGRVVHGEAR